MAVFEVESWLVKEGKEEEHKIAMRQWFKWVGEHRDLFKEWKSVRYFKKTVAGEGSGRHLIIWEYESLADITQARKLLDYEPQVEFIEGLRRSIDYYRSLHEEAGAQASSRGA